MISTNLSIQPHLAAEHLDDGQWAQELNQSGQGLTLLQGFYTNFLVWVTIQEKHPHTNILPPTGLKGISPEEIQDRIYGAKATFVLEASMVMTQFLTKLCMCLLFYKLTYVPLMSWNVSKVLTHSGPVSKDSCKSS